MRMRRSARAVIVVLVLALATSPLNAGDGPAQPEALQFEPVDVTDVVNLATGDFVYTLPLFEVPGPNGGYPLAMSYHSGIGPNQEATWVGLGWTLNVGAINRILEGYPDDFRGGSVTTAFDGQGGEETTLSLGVYYGVPFGSVGMNFSYEVNSGMLGANASIAIVPGPLRSTAGYLAPSASLSAGTSGFSAGVGLSAGHRSGFNANVSAGTSGLRSGVGYSNGITSAGLSAGRGGVSGSFSTSLTGNESVGFSMSSTGVGASFSRGGGRGAFSLISAGNGAWHSSGFSVPIPLPGGFFASLGVQHRHWSLKELHRERAYGFVNQAAYHASPELYKKYERTEKGGALYPSHDQYLVAAQGLSGSISPYYTTPYLLVDGEDNNDKGQLSKDISGGSVEPSEVVWRFEGDQGGNLVVGESSWGASYGPLSGASKRIDTVENEDGLIVGFLITDHQGKTYEFLEPVFAGIQSSWSRVVDDEGYTLENSMEFGDEYASQWLLTGIKGADYVDRGVEGFDSDDWGYWVAFEYTTDDRVHLWRTPYQGMTSSPDPTADDNESYSWGTREAVYLSTIRTATHQASFVDSPSSNRVTPPNRSAWAKYYGITSSFDLSAYSGGTHVFEFDGAYCGSISNLDDETVIGAFTVGLDGNQTYYYVHAGEVGCIEDGGNSNRVSTVTAAGLPSGGGVYGTILVKPQTLTLDDVLGSRGRKLESIQLRSLAQPERIIKEVAFDYDYSLRPNTPGSDASSGAGSGALALRAVQFKGRDGVVLTPPYRFDYANNDAPGTGLNPGWGEHDWDNWGSYRDPIGGPSGPTVHMTPQDAARADLAAAWSLTRITTPLGGTIDVEYESDEYTWVGNAHNLDVLERSSIANISSQVNTSITTSLLYVNSTNNIGLEVGEPVHVIRRQQGSRCLSCEQYEGVWYSVEERIVESFDTQSITLENSVELEGPQFGGLGGSCGGTCTVSYTNDYWVAGSGSVFGGGSRVKSIQTSTGVASYETQYRYVDESGRSSGATPSLPSTYEVQNRYGGDNVNLYGEIRSLTESYMHHEDSHGRPNPAVLYGRVEVLNGGNVGEVGINGKTVYEYYTAYDFPYLSGANVDYSGIYGKPKRVTYYDAHNIPVAHTGSGITIPRVAKVEEPEYAFSRDLDEHGRVFQHNETGYGWENVVLAGVDPDTSPLGLTQLKYGYRNEAESNNIELEERVYPNVFDIGALSKEYFYDGDTDSPEDSIETRRRNMGWDARSGQTLLAATEHDDTVLLQRSTPAYWLYPQLRDKNMLAQGGQTSTYRLDPGVGLDDTATLNAYEFLDADVLSSEVTTWADEEVQDAAGATVHIWRKNDTYAYVPDFDFQAFPTPSLDYVGHAYPTPSEGTPWEMTSNVTLYDRFSRPVESVARGGNYSATLYGYGEALPVAIASPARYSELFYMDFEGESGDNGYRAAPGTGRTGAHATKAKLRDFGNSFQFYLEPGMSYHVSFWAKRGTASPLEKARLKFSEQSTVIGNVSAVLSTGGWELVEGTITPQDGNVNVSILTGEGSGASPVFHYVDEIRIHPKEARMSTYVYDALTAQVTAITDANNVSAFFEYDPAGRLIRVHDQDGHLVQRHRYVTADFSIQHRASGPIHATAVPVEGATYEWTVNGSTYPSTESSVYLQNTAWPHSPVLSISLRLLDQEGRVLAERHKEVQVD